MVLPSVRVLRRLWVFASGAVGLALAGCAAAPSSETAAGTSPDTAALVAPSATGEAPLSLIRKRVQPLGDDARVPLAQDAVEAALRRIATNRNANVSSAQIVGVDLNADGIGEALVYLSGETWCVHTGCTLLILRDQGRGFWPFAEIKRVKLPVVLAHTSSRGWRDLLVRTGGGGMKRMAVKLAFGGDGYPANASVLQPFLGNAVANGTVMLDKAAPDAGPATIPASANPSGISDAQGREAG